MNFTRSAIPLLALACLLLGGCQKAPRSAVVDLDAVAKAMGRDTAITRAVEAATQQLNTQLLQAAREMEEELKKIQAKGGASPTPEQQSALRQARMQVQQNIQNNKLIAESARNRVRAEQVLLFRNEVKPIAAEIARQRKSDVVLISSDDVIWFDAGADITGEVISRLRARPDRSPSTETKPANGGDTPAPAPTNTAAAPAK